MGTSAPHIQSQVHRHRANWRGLVVVLRSNLIDSRAAA